MNASQSADQFSQTFQIFSEENWNRKQNSYNRNISQFFSGKKNEFFADIKEDSIHFLIGIGKSDVSDFDIQRLAMKFSNQYRKNLLAVKTGLIAEDLNQNQFESFYKGLFLGTYEYPFKKDHPVLQAEFSLYYKDENITHSELHRQALVLLDSQSLCQEWLNKPANFKNPEILTEFLKDFSNQNNLKHTVFNRQKCEEIGLGAYLAVNQGSAYDAAFTVLEYHSGKENAKTIGLVGKCVTFDTGGISIKGSENMHYMKSDMGGATAVLGALSYVSKMKLPVNIVAILPITDNAVSEKSYLPSDVVTAYNGKTIEVLNTDAEGRMTLADALSYLSKNYKTDALIDLATLTGSAVRMFGDTCAAMFSNNAEMRDALTKSGDKTGQRVWNLPLWDIWKDDFTSNVADFKNISSKPIGDCIVAAKFLEQFIEGHQNWAHLDIAGVAFGNVDYSKEKAATGFGVQLLIDLMENYL